MISTKSTILRLHVLRVALIAMALLMGGFGVQMTGAALLTWSGAGPGAGDGSRAFFMSVSGLTLAVFCIGFVMMVREVSAAIATRAGKLQSR